MEEEGEKFNGVRQRPSKELQTYHFWELNALLTVENNEVRERESGQESWRNAMRGAGGALWSCRTAATKDW